MQDYLSSKAVPREILEGRQLAEPPAVYIPDRPYQLRWARIRRN
jgi:hypothetical protein